MDGLAILLALVLAVVFLGGPILALVTWLHLRRLEARLGGFSPPNVALLLSRLNALDARVAELTRSLERSPTPAPTEAAEISAVPRTITDAAATELVVAPQATSVPAPAVEPPAALPRAPSAPRAADVDFETRVAGRWLNRVGLIAVVVGVSFFLKYAIDNAWVGPAGQVALGLLLGVAIVTLSVYIHRRGQTYFADGLTGLGGAVLYLSLWAGGNYYTLLPASASFAAMIVVTAALVAVAVGRRSQRVALLALIGGFATPALVSTGADRQVILFLYLALLNAGLLPLARRHDWRWLEPLAFVSTQIYFWGWYDRFYTAERLWITTTFAALFFIEFLQLSAIRSASTGRLLRQQVMLVFANGGLLLIALRVMMWPDRRWVLTAAALALAAVHLVVARAARAPDPARDRDDPPAALLFAGVALTFVTLAVPIALEGRWITMFWAVEAAVLVWSGLRARVQWLRAAGLLLFAVVGWRLLALPLSADRFLLNARFGLYVVVMTCAALSLWWTLGAREILTKAERPWFWALGVATNVLAIVAVTLEVYEYFDPSASGSLARDAYLAAGLTTSLFWTTYASGLLYFGTRRRLAGLRWLGLALFGVTTVKVFVVDFAGLSGIYRVVSSLALGVVLLVISFVYQRRVASSSREEVL